jgi:hypothetical protein
MIGYWSERCMLRPSLWFATGQNTVCYDQVYDLLLVRTLYVTTKFMICYWSERCMLDQVYDLLLVRTLYVRPSLWFVTGQNAVCYDQVYDLLLVKTLYAMTKFMICYWSEHYVMTKFMICYWSKHCMLWPSLWFVTGQNSVCYDQVYDLL